jgi:tyrosinase
MHRISRRTLIASVAGTAAAGALPFSICASQQAKAQTVAPVVRHDVSTPEGQAMLKKYAQAVTKMMDTAQIPEADPTSWLFQWYSHAVPTSTTKNAEIDRVYGSVPPADPTDPTRLLANATWDTCRAHEMTGLPQDEDDFLPWHRMFVYFHERIIRKILSDDTFTLPYWDYTTAGKRSTPEQFRMPTDPLYKVLFRDNRNDGSFPGTADVNAGEPLDANAPGRINAGALISANYQDNVAIQGFNSALDFGLHGAIHVLTGNRTTNMGTVPWAARDPIFWMHHCNIDRLWASWNKGGRLNPTGAWLTNSFEFADENGVSVSPVNGDFVDTETIADAPYTYDKFEPVPPLPPGPAGAMVMAPAPAMIIADQAQPGPIMLSGANEVEVALKPAVAPLEAMLAAAGEGGRVYLLLQGISTSAQPGILYDVYLDPAAGGAAAEPQPVGTINFFGAESHGAHRGVSSPAKRYSFDVTDLVKEGGTADPESAPTVRVAPVGTPPAEASPVIGAISLVRQ